MSTNDDMKNPEPPAGQRSLQERARRAWLWVIQYWKALFDFSFEKYMIIQMLPILYGMLLFAMGVGIIYLIVEAFASGSHWRGFFYLFFAGPLTFVVLASLLRGLLEFYMVVFRIAEDVDELAGVRDTVDKLSGLSDRVDEMASLTRRIPFWKVIMGRNPPSARRLSAERRDAEQRTGDTKPRDGKS
ncbi:MAG: DUF4282 domain-containing protein [Pseudomonadota bacterium]